MSGKRTSGSPLNPAIMDVNSISRKNGAENTARVPIRSIAERRSRMHFPVATQTNAMIHKSPNKDDARFGCAKVFGRVKELQIRSVLSGNGRHIRAAAKDDPLQKQNLRRFGSCHCYEGFVASPRYHKVDAGTYVDFTGREHRVDSTLYSGQRM